MIGVVLCMTPKIVGFYATMVVDALAWLRLHHLRHEMNNRPARIELRRRVPGIVGKTS